MRDVAIENPQCGIQLFFVGDKVELWVSDPQIMEEMQKIIPRKVD